MSRSWSVSCIRGSSWLAALMLVLMAGSDRPALGATCEVPDNGSETAALPPSGPNCLDGYVGQSKFLISDGLPPGTTIEIDGSLTSFSGIVAGPGGSLGGELEQFDAVFEMSMSGTGALAGFSRFISVPLASMETESGPRTPGDAVQSFDTELTSLDGQLFGDPDFDALRIRAGTSQGLASSPGHTTLIRQGVPGSDFAVDSFFDITYRIEFVGAPGGQLDGLSGTTTAGSTPGVDPVRIQAGEPVEQEPGIPVLPEPGLILFAALLLGTSIWMIQRRLRFRT